MCDIVVFVYDCGHKLLVRLGCEVRNFYLCDIEKSKNVTRIKKYDCACCEERLENMRVAAEAKNKNKTQTFPSPYPEEVEPQSSPYRSSYPPIEPEEIQHFSQLQSHMQMSDIPMRDRLTEQERERVASWIMKHNEEVERGEREGQEEGSDG